MTTRATGWTALIRLLVGAVFISEGLQKFLFPATLGVGRFHTLGIPLAQFAAPFVGGCEVACGALIVLGLFTRPACAVLLNDMAVAIAATKVPLYRQHGFWAFAHESRTDYAMVIALLFLLIVGAGSVSFDRLFTRSRTPPAPRLAASRRDEAASPAKPTASPP